MRDETDRRSAISTTIVMACTAASRILGFVRTAIISALFGAGGSADVINLVFNIPNNLRKLLAEGALSAAFIPELSRELHQDPTGQGSRDLTARIIGFQMALLIPLLGVALIFPRQSLVLFESFDDAAKRELSVVLFRWMMPYLLLVSVSAVMMAVHNSHGAFFIPAMTPIVFSLCVMGSLMLAYRQWGSVSVGFGVLAGGLAQILVQFPSFKRLGYRLKPSFSFRNPAFLRVMKKWAPMLITSSLFAINNQVAMLLASVLPNKSASALSYAIVFYQLPFGVFSASIATVLFPRMSRQAARGDRPALMNSLWFGYRNLAALLLPSAMLMTLMGEPIVAVAFQRHSFSLGDTLLTSRVLAAYSVGMPFVGVFNITQRAFYALGEVRKPFICAMLTVLLDIILSLVFVFCFKGQSESLAWANSLAFFFGALLQYILIQRSTGISLTRRSYASFGKTALCTAAAAGFVLTVLEFGGRDWWKAGSSWKALGLLMAVLIPAAALVLGLYAWMKVEIVSIMLKKGKGHA